MAPPLSNIHLEMLNTEFYTNKNLFGRDKMFNIMKEKYDDHPPRRQIADWLAVQEVNQLYHPSKRKAKDIKSSMTTPNTIIAIDLVDLQKVETRGFTYLLNGIDMSSRFIYRIKK
jgi:hypothetical protein